MNYEDKQLLVLASCAAGICRSIGSLADLIREIHGLEPSLEGEMAADDIWSGLYFSCPDLEEEVVKMIGKKSAPDGQSRPFAKKAAERILTKE